jgi:hypothetical protein
MTGVVEHTCPHCDHTWVGSAYSDSACLSCRELEAADRAVLAAHIRTERRLVRRTMQELNMEIVDLLSPAYARVRAAWRNAAHV